MGSLERAIAIAAEAHADRTDKAGEPYILHPLRVMLTVPPDCREAAALHDVVEDGGSDWTLERLLREGFRPAVVTAVDALTRRGGERYDDYIVRCGANSIARTVKKADLMDNMNGLRLAALPKDEAKRLHEKYWRAHLALL